MPNKYDLSVIVPVYNAEKYIESCISSIVNQTYKNLEVIIIDDGSTDDSFKILEKFKSLNNVKIIRKVNDGLSNARNTGLCESSGSYITFVDNDDILDLNIYENAMRIINDKELDLLEFSVSIDFEDDGYSREERIPTTFLKSKSDISDGIPNIMNSGLFNYVWNKIYKASVLLENSIKFEKDASNYEDLLFNFNCFEKIRNFYHLDMIGYHYKKRKTESMVAKYVNNNDIIIKDKRKELEKFIEKMGLIENLEMTEIKNKLVVLNLEDFTINLFREKCDLSFKKKIKQVRKNVLSEENRVLIRKFNAEHLFDRIFRFLCFFNSSYVLCISYFLLTFFKKNFYFLFSKLRA